MNKTAIYTGTFDPITYGHLDIITRATKIFDSITIAISNNLRKKTIFNFPCIKYSILKKNSLVMHKVYLIPGLNK